MDSQELEILNSLSEKMAMEVVFAEIGKDVGLLPLNSLLMEMEGTISSSIPPEPISKAVQLARHWLDEIFATEGFFTEAAIKHFQEWVEWLQGALRSMNCKAAIPATPSHWTQAEMSSASALSNEKSSIDAKLPITAAESTVTIDAVSDAELLREFINEASEHLQNIEQGVLVLEENPGDKDILNTIFRAFHTFKGCAGFLKLTAIQELAHELESLLDQVRQNKLSVSAAVINLVLDGSDRLRQFVMEMDAQLSGKSPPGPIRVPTQQLLERIREMLRGGEAISGASLSNHLPVVAAINEKGRDFAEAQNPSKNSIAGSSVKVDTLKLDSLVDLIGELVIGQSLVVQNQALLGLQDQGLTRDIAQLGRVTKELQRMAMSLRMVPIRSTFQKMQRLVRDTAVRLGKEVELITEGEETELDRTIIEEISDPLIHMIRNAIDHGIELPEVRQQRGKPTQGTIWLKAFYLGGQIIIEIRDDGNGLDKDRLLAKAIEKGMVSAEAVMTESEIFGLIFAAGFSLAQKVSDLSGRGVGMDVVRRNIEKLRGKVDIQSVLGQGSTFSISVPLTLAIIDGLIVGVGEQRYILPTFSVSESFRPTREMINSVQGKRELMNVRGRLRPVLRLHEYLGIKPSSTDPTESIAVVVEAGTNARCVLVDQLLGKQEVVIKSLGETFKENRALAGAAILGDGRVGLILDPQSLVDSERNFAPR